MTPAEISVNGKPASLNTAVRKGDEVTIIPAQHGEDAAAYLSDYLDTSSLYMAEISFCGDNKTIGKYILVNNQPVTADREIENGSTITTFDCSTLGELCRMEEILPEYVLLNGSAASPETALNDGDEVTMKREEAVQPAPAATPAAEATEPAVISDSDDDVLHVIFNGEPAKFPIIDKRREPIFLDLLAAFSENPTALLQHATTTTINGRIARLGEVIHDGDEIIIE